MQNPLVIGRQDERGAGLHSRVAVGGVLRAGVMGALLGPAEVQVQEHLWVDGPGHRRWIGHGAAPVPRAGQARVQGRHP